MPNSKKSGSFTLYVLHIPVLLLLVAVFVGSSVVAYKTAKKSMSNSGSVLSSESEEGEDGDKDEDKNEGKNESDKKTEEKRKEDKKREEEKTRENAKQERVELRTVAKTEGEKFKDADENENEVDLENEDEGRMKTTETVSNPDGTTSQITKIAKEGKIKIEEIIFDANGNKVGVKKTESNEKSGKEKTEEKTYDVFGRKLTEVKFETESGKELKVEIENAGVSKSKVKFNSEEGELEVEYEDEDENELADEDKESTVSEKRKLKIKAKGEDFVLVRSDVSAVSKFPISIDSATGVVSVKTPAGSVELKHAPDVIVEKARLSSVSSVELKSENGLEYEIDGKDEKRLFGVIKIAVPKTLLYSATTGELLENRTALVNKILNLFSF